MKGIWIAQGPMPTGSETSGTRIRVSIRLRSERVLRDAHAQAGSWGAGPDYGLSRRSTHRTGVSLQRRSGTETLTLSDFGVGGSE